MAQHPSAQTDRFVHDRLPPPEQWPELRYDLPELQTLPAQLNVVQALFERAFSAGHAERPFLRSDDCATQDQRRDEIKCFSHVSLPAAGMVPRRLPHPRSEVVDRDRRDGVCRREPEHGAIKEQLRLQTTNDRVCPAEAMLLSLEG